MTCNNRVVNQFSSEEAAIDALNVRYKEVQHNVWVLPTELSTHHFVFIYGSDEKQLVYKIQKKIIV